MIYVYILKELTTNLRIIRTGISHIDLDIPPNLKRAEIIENPMLKCHKLEKELINYCKVIEVNTNWVTSHPNETKTIFIKNGASRHVSIKPTPTRKNYFDNYISIIGHLCPLITTTQTLLPNWVTAK